MNIWEFFQSAAVSLPKKRQENDFETYLLQIFRDYLDHVDKLDPACFLGSSILAQKATIFAVGGWVRGAVRQYLQGQPELAYCQLRTSIYSLKNVGNLISKDIAPADIGPLYRMSKLKRRELSKGRLFHIPFHRRHKVGRHRYGIPGLPCLYLGGSLEVCRREIDVAHHHLHKAAIAEFAPTHTVRLLDFGYKPFLMAQLAQGRVLAQQQGKDDPLFDNFIVNYAVCWPLIAACSIRRLHSGKDDHFAAEYVVPQLLLQWVMRETMCDGIRYFSTWLRPNTPDIKPAVNYVFPALPPPQNGYSQKLRQRFAMTEPCMWRGMCWPRRILIKWLPCTKKWVLPGQFEANSKHLAALPKATL